MDQWKRAHTRLGFENLDHSWERLFIYGTAAAFWIHLATYLLTRHHLISGADNPGGWLALTVLALPGNIRAALMIAIGPPRRKEWTTTWLSPRANPLNQRRRNRQKAEKRKSSAATLVKILAGLTLFAACAGYAGYAVTGGNFVDPSDTTAEPPRLRNVDGGNLVDPLDTTTEPPRLRNVAEKRLMLDLINEARDRAGVPPVVMGTNNVAQIQADQLLENCVLSHWGTDGLKPYMRYSLAGGHQVNGENALTYNECGLADTFLQWNKEPSEMVADSVDGLLDSPGHRETMLSPSYRRVNIGLAWDRNTFKAVQHFEGDYVHLSQLPVIVDGELTLEGRLEEEYEFDGRHPLTALVIYDPVPRTLTPGQLLQTSCYSHGEVIAGIIPPSPLFGSGYEYSETVEGPKCTDPYKVGSGAERPNTQEEMERIWNERKARSEQISETEVSFEVMRAQDLTIEGPEFTLSADVRDLLEEHGPGIYTVALLAELESTEQDGQEVISEYSVFYKVEPPRTYGRD